MSTKEKKDYELNLQPSDIKFLETLQEGENAVVFKVLVHDKICVLKVYHGMIPDPLCYADTEYDLFIRESTAYKRLKEKGLCDKKVVPDFYGTIQQIQLNSQLWPELYPIFCDDECPPNATLIEYIPFLQELDLTTFSKTRLIKLRQILDEIHQAKVLHHDAYPRNMMVALEPGKEDEERVLWIDFDSAQTFPEDEWPLSELHETWLREEDMLVNQFLEKLTLDHADGKLSRAWPYYYERI